MFFKIYNILLVGYPRQFTTLHFLSKNLKKAKTKIAPITAKTHFYIKQVTMRNSNNLNQKPRKKFAATPKSQ